MDKIKESVLRHKETVVALRRHFHQHPEVGGEEFATQARIIEELTALGLSPKKIADTGVIADLKGAHPGKMVALRADIDALPIQDEIDKPYKSTIPGKCHACGHDAHTAMLLTLARVFTDLKADIHGTIRLMFQPSEERFPGGAERMVAAGCMEGVDYVLGAHVWQPLPAGKIGISYGRTMAAPDQFTIFVQGKGGHGSMPQGTVCALSTGAEIVSMLNSILGRNVNPLESAVVSLGSFHSGEVFNIIPDTAEIKGTVRTFDDSVRKLVWDRFDEICAGVCSARGATYTVDKVFGYPAVINNPEISAVVAEAGREAAGAEAVVEIGPSMGGEDFSYFMQKAPGMFLMLGGGNPATDAIYPHHHPKFDIDDSVLPIGVETFARATFKLLAR